MPVERLAKKRFCLATHDWPSRSILLSSHVIEPLTSGALGPTTTAAQLSAQQFANATRRLSLQLGTATGPNGEVHDCADAFDIQGADAITPLAPQMRAIAMLHRLFAGTDLGTSQAAAHA